MTRMENEMEKLDGSIMKFTGDDLSNLTLADINDPEQQLEFSVTKIHARKAKF
uniref:K-box domain-containing protein n=1 Tax=Oryza brachyantha TaxID=4533 RepID=J3M7I6_ORYBR